MKFNALLSLVLAMGAAASVAAVAGAADVTGASAVYILPMAGGMDQYLALRLTTGNVMQVVTDPQKADVVLTDHLGGAFEDKLKDLYPPPVVKKETKDGDKKDKDENLFTLQRGSSQPMSRSRGAYFLVDRQTHNVIWSTYARAKSSDPDEVNHTADQIAKELAKARKPKTVKEQ